MNCLRECFATLRYHIPDLPVLPAKYVIVVISRFFFVSRIETREGNEIRFNQRNLRKKVFKSWEFRGRN